MAIDLLTGAVAHCWPEMPTDWTRMVSVLSIPKLRICMITGFVEEHSHGSGS